MSADLPESLMKLRTTFQAFYNSKHTGRKLTFINSLGTADLICAFPSCKREINVSTFAMVLLLIFNERSSYSYEELAAETGIGPKDLLATLASLYIGKYKILLKNGDIYTFNDKFTSNLSKIKIIPVSATSVSEASEATQIDSQRKNQIEASVIRTMKSRQKMDHANLVSEVIGQLEKLFLVFES
jgi:cullin 3